MALVPLNKTRKTIETIERSYSSLIFMADKNERYEDNVPGIWYVDKKCIICSVCAETAPKNFKEAPSGDHDIVFKQPVTPEEISQCEEAMAACPVEAIGNDG